MSGGLTGADARGAGPLQLMLDRKDERRLEAYVLLGERRVHVDWISVQVDGKRLRIGEHVRLEELAQHLQLLFQEAIGAIAEEQSRVGLGSVKGQLEKEQVQLSKYSGFYSRQLDYFNRADPSRMNHAMTQILKLIQEESLEAANSNPKGLGLSKSSYRIEKSAQSGEKGSVAPLSESSEELAQQSSQELPKQLLGSDSPKASRSWQALSLVEQKWDDADQVGSTLGGDLGSTRSNARAASRLDQLAKPILFKRVESRASEAALHVAEDEWTDQQEELDQGWVEHTLDDSSSRGQLLQKSAGSQPTALLSLQSIEEYTDEIVKYVEDYESTLPQDVTDWHAIDLKQQELVERMAQWLSCTDRDALALLYSIRRSGWLSLQLEPQWDGMVQGKGKLFTAQLAYLYFAIESGDNFALLQEWEGVICSEQSSEQERADRLIQLIQYSATALSLDRSSFSFAKALKAWCDHPSPFVLTIPNQLCDLSTLNALMSLLLTARSETSPKKVLFLSREANSMQTDLCFQTLPWSYQQQSAQLAQIEAQSWDELERTLVIFDLAITDPVADYGKPSHSTVDPTERALILQAQKDPSLSIKVTNALSLVRHSSFRKNSLFIKKQKIEQAKSAIEMRSRQSRSDLVTPFSLAKRQELVADLSQSLEKETAAFLEDAKSLEKRVSEFGKRGDSSSADLILGELEQRWRVLAKRLQELEDQRDASGRVVTIKMRSFFQSEIPKIVDSVKKIEAKIKLEKDLIRVIKGGAFHGKSEPR